jgi:hypothetical protein
MFPGERRAGARELLCHSAWRGKKAYISDFKMPDDGSQLESRHVALSKLIKAGVLYDRSDTCSLIYPVQFLK